MLNYRKSVLFGFVFLVCSVSVQAATWSVEKDGTGDFTVIQHAVDAAVDGDTILIGPGRYEDFELFNSGAWIEEIVVVIQKNNLTLRGAGVEETIIGPADYYAPYAENPQLITGIAADNVRIENLSVENCEYGIVWNSGAITIDGCRVTHCYYGIWSHSPDGTTIMNSEFFQQGGWSIVTAGGCENANVSHSVFHGFSTSIGFNSTPNANVFSCSFEGAYTAIGYTQGSSGQVLDCNVTDVLNPVYISDSSQVNLINNYLESSTGGSLLMSGNSYVSGNNNVFSGGEEYPTLRFSGGCTADLYGNHILKGNNPYSVGLINYFYDYRIINLENNYWGTTDLDVIEGWIFDSNDDATIHGTVSFLPLADGPVSTEETTLDGLKAMFK